MNTRCDIIRDLLPLYADDACSEASRETVEAHLRKCPECASYLEKIRTSEAEDRLKEEKALVIRNQARQFRKRSAVVGSRIAAFFMIPILMCLVINLTTGLTLDWFFIVVAAMLVAASLIVVPLMMPEDKLFWTFCAFCVSLTILLAVCCLYTRGTWFYVANSASLFGLSVISLPFIVRAKPLRSWMEGRNKTFIILSVDFILFWNMMNMISLRDKGLGVTIFISVLLVAALCFLVGNIVLKKKKP